MVTLRGPILPSIQLVWKTGILMITMPGCLSLKISLFLRHVGQDLTAYQMWSNLEAIHKVTEHTTIINYIHTLFKCNAEEGDDIVKHLNTLKTTWEHVNSLSVEEFRISDLFFKIIISSLLLPSWDNFTQAYIAEVHRYATCNPFKDMSSQEFIGVIKSEAEQHRKTNKSENANFGSAKGKKKKKPSLSSG
jgi:hypothetical protein